MVGPDPEGHRLITFGPFRVDRIKRVVERNGVPVQIGSRAFDILAHLLERPGEVISKRALLNAAWPTTNVEEGNLRFQITMLRQALGDKTYIVNVPGRGYCFTAPLSEHRVSDASSAQGHDQGLLGLAPRPVRVGRGQAVHDVSALIRAHRMVTIVGTGGLGKSSVAVTVTGEVRHLFRDGVCFVDLTSVQSATAVAETVGLALGLPASASADAIAETLRHRKMLLIVDGCERLIGAVAALVEHILAAAPSICVLATSREALRIEHERVFALDPLPAPPGQTSPSQIVNFPAALLFIESSGGSLKTALTQHDARYIGEICVKLNGVPLAIEIAAAQAQVVGLMELAGLVEDHVSLDWPGRRTAPPRHRSLRAMIGWSYQLLTDREKKVFRSLAVFTRWFSLSDANEIASDDSFTSAAFVATVDELVSKTLLTAAQLERRNVYQLPGVTRTFARAKLSEEGERDTAGERHARHILRAMQASQVEDPAYNKADQIEDARAALAWASSPSGDPVLRDALARAIAR